MRKLSNTIKNLLLRDNLQVFLAIKIELVSTTIYYTNFYRDIVIAGNTYISSNKLKMVSPPSLSSDIDREVYKVQLSDVDMYFRADVEGGLVGKTAIVYFGFVNNTDSAIVGVAPGLPFLDIEDLIIGYKGKIDTHAYDLNAVDGERLLSIDCASPMAALDLIRGRYTSKASQRAINPNDSAFDKIFVGSAESTLLWGK